MRRRDFLSLSAAAPLAAAAPWAERLLPAPPGGGFRMDEWWVWCGSAIRGEDGRYHMFASRWPRALPFAAHWLTNSEVVRAVAEKPEGPYRFEEVVLAPRGGRFWDGRTTHNPTIHRAGDTWLLYYIGTTYSGETPAPGRPMKPGTPMQLEARANQRIGLATAKSVHGPWTRLDRPILEPRPGKWDALMTTNPAPCVLADGGVLLVYKATRDQKDLLRMGVARAKHWRGPYQRAKDGELFHFANPDDHVEDAYVWRTARGFELIMKDMRGGISGERGGGIHAVSADGLEWKVSQPALAWRRTLAFQDGSRRTFARVERPQLLIEDGRLRYLFVAVGEADASGRLTRSWNQAIPLRDV